jgi:hypothetical protein
MKKSFFLVFLNRFPNQLGNVSSHNNIPLANSQATILKISQTIGTGNGQDACPCLHSLLEPEVRQPFFLLGLLPDSSSPTTTTQAIPAGIWHLN